MAEVQGSCTAEFGKLREILAASIASGEDLGASVAVVHRG
jgi:hypothetical protein